MKSLARTYTRIGSLLVLLLFASACTQAPLPTPRAGSAPPSPPFASPGTVQTASGTRSGSPLVTAQSNAEAPRAGGTLRYGLTLPVSGIDPHIHASSELGIALNSVYDTLVVQDTGGNFHPGLAQNWTISPDGRTYSFRLRQDVTFHDGTPFNAASVVRNLRRIADPATRSQKAIFLLGPFDRAEATGEYDVSIYLKDAYAPLLDGLSQVYTSMASPAALDKWGDQYQLHQVGTGPFRFVSYQERQELILERNPGYNWAPETRAHQGPAYLDRIEFRFYADPATRLPALLSGQADVMGEMPVQDAARLEKDAAYRLVPAAIPGLSVQFMLNTARAPLDDVAVRQALLYGTDRAALVNAIFGPSSPVAGGPLTAVTKGAERSLAGLYPFDAGRARASLAKAGWTTTDKDGILTRNGQRLALKGILQSWGELAKVGTILQAQWRTLGIDLQLSTMTYPAALEAGQKGDYDLFPFVSSGTDPDILRPYFHSGPAGSFNFTKAVDPEVDNWLDGAARAGSWAERGPLYGQVQQRVMEQAWVLPIRDQVNLNAATARVQALAYDVQGWFPVLYDVWLTGK